MMAHGPQKHPWQWYVQRAIWATGAVLIFLAVANDDNKDMATALTRGAIGCLILGFIFSF